MDSLLLGLTLSTALTLAPPPYRQHLLNVPPPTSTTYDLWIDRTVEAAAERFTLPIYASPSGNVSIHLFVTRDWMRGEKPRVKTESLVQILIRF